MKGRRTTKRAAEEAVAKAVEARRAAERTSRAAGPRPLVRTAHDALEELWRGARRATWAAAVANRWVAVDVVRRRRSLISRTSHEVDDVIQEALLGLVRALEDYEPTRPDGRRQEFVTYAWTWARAMTGRAITRTGRLVRIPGWVTDLSRAVDRRDRGARPRPRDAARLRLLDRMQGETQAALDGLAAQPASLSAPSGAQLDPTVYLRETCRTKLGAAFSEHSLRMSGLWIHDDQDDDPEDRLAALRAAVEGLSPGQRQVLALRWGLDDGRERSLDDVASELPPVGRRVGGAVVYAKVSRQAVSLREREAVRKLRAALGATDVPPRPRLRVSSEPKEGA